MKRVAPPVGAVNGNGRRNGGQTTLIYGSHEAAVKAGTCAVVDVPITCQRQQEVSHDQGEPLSQLIISQACSLLAAAIASWIHCFRCLVIKPERQPRLYKRPRVGVFERAIHTGHPGAVAGKRAVSALIKEPRTRRC